MRLCVVVRLTHMTPGKLGCYGDSVFRAFFLCRICVVFIVTIRLKPYRGVKGDWFLHWGAVTWVKILGDARSQAENCLIGNSQGHSQGEQVPQEILLNGMMRSFVLSAARGDKPLRGGPALMLVRDAHSVTPRNGPHVQMLL